jgi:hypothetical protein
LNAFQVCIPRETITRVEDLVDGRNPGIRLRAYTCNGAVVNSFVASSRRYWGSEAQLPYRRLSIAYVGEVVVIPGGLWDVPVKCLFQLVDF